ncbi:MAG: hypothetical protein ABJN42_11320 [Roseibium sp.]|uniref:hypothetical protein n=1 Tax=Roseibium sp. TaxID=1936156 RepID=UPI0032998B86
MKQKLHITKPIVICENAIAFGQNQVLSLRHVEAVSIGRNSQEMFGVIGGIGFITFALLGIIEGSGQMLLAAALFFLVLLYALSRHHMTILIQCASGKTLKLEYAATKKGIDLACDDYGRLNLAVAGDPSVAGQSEDAKDAPVKADQKSASSKYDPLLARAGKGVMQ